MEEIILDLETKKAFSQINRHNLAQLGISFVGICRRDLSGLSKDEFRGFYENELSDLWPILEKAERLIGFNIKGFDLPVLAAYYHGDVSSFAVLDILDEVKKQVGYRVSLDKIAGETLGAQKSGSGLDALRFYEQGKLKELADYCLMDVRITRDIHDYGKKHKHLKFKNKWNRLVEVEVDFSLSQNNNGSQVQMSLGV